MNYRYSKKCVVFVTNKKKIKENKAITRINLSASVYPKPFLSMCPTQGILWYIRNCGTCTHCFI